MNPTSHRRWPRCAAAPAGCAAPRLRAAVQRCTPALCARATAAKASSGRGAPAAGPACAHRCRALQLPLDHGADTAGCAAWSRPTSVLFAGSLRPRRAARSSAPRAGSCVRPGSGPEAWKHRRAAQRAAAVRSRAHAGRRSLTACSGTPAGLPRSARSAAACVASAWRVGGRCARAGLRTASARQPPLALPIASNRHKAPAACRGGAGARGLGQVAVGTFGHAQQRSGRRQD